MERFSNVFFNLLFFFVYVSYIFSSLFVQRGPLYVFFVIFFFIKIKKKYFYQKDTFLYLLCKFRSELYMQLGKTSIMLLLFLLFLAGPAGGLNKHATTTKKKYCKKKYCKKKYLARLVSFIKCQLLTISASMMMMISVMKNKNKK